MMIKQELLDKILDCVTLKRKVESITSDGAPLYMFEIDFDKTYIKLKEQGITIEEPDHLAKAREFSHMVNKDVKNGVEKYNAVSFSHLKYLYEKAIKQIKEGE